MTPVPQADRTLSGTMIFVRAWSMVVLGLVLAGPPPTGGAPERRTQAVRLELPPLSYTCPMDPDIVEDKPGACPRCRMTLEPIRLDSAFSCPVHTSAIQPRAGQCPICRRELVPITVSLYFTCAGAPNVRELSPGTCPDGSARTVVRERRVHGDHNPRHGGQFFMAPDNWHHLEGTYPAPGVFRVYLYDDFTRPLSKRLLQDARGRASVSDAAARPLNGTAAVPLQMAKDGRALEARLAAPLPARISLRLSFAAGGPEHRFDFAFPAYTSEPKPKAPAAPAATPTAAANLTGAPGETSSDIAALVQEVKQQRQAVDGAVSSGSYGSIYIAALAAKDAALRLESLDGRLPEPQRVLVSAAVKRIVVSAWLLDMYGDLGDRQKIEESLQAFDAGIDELMARYVR